MSIPPVDHFFRERDAVGWLFGFESVKFSRDGVDVFIDGLLATFNLAIDHFRDSVNLIRHQVDRFELRL